MPDNPEWLPDIVSVDGGFDDVVRMLYQIFCRDIIETNRTFRTFPVWFDRRKQDSEYEEGFWHIITRKDRSSGERLLDPRRAERVPWCGPTISHSHDAEVRAWEYEEGKRQINTYIWLENFDYLVVLTRKNIHNRPVYFLVTVYHVDGPSTKRKLYKKYNDRIA